MEELKVIDEKGLHDVFVFQVCESDSVASYSLEEAIEFYKNLTGLTDDDLYEYDEIEIVSFDKKVRDGEDSQGLITVGEIVKRYWEGKPFIATTFGY